MYRREVLELRVADEGRSIFDEPPSWFIETMRSLSPDSHWWQVTKDLDGADSDWGGDGEAAVMVFQGEFRTHDSFDRWFDHAGWVEESGRTIFVSEPYAIDSDATTGLLSFVNKCNLEMKISGLCHHYPSWTFRISLWPKDDSREQQKCVAIANEIYKESRNGSDRFVAKHSA